MPNQKKLTFLFFLSVLLPNVIYSQNFLKTSGRNIINQNGDTIVLRGIGLGGWMVQEGYMMAPGGFSGTQFQIRDKITDLIGEEETEKFYDNCPFHRVIDRFMAQTGDGSNHNGTGGSKYPNLKQEFSKEPHVRGTVSMARAQDVDSANSQFFICYADTPHLNEQYTVFGKVISGMEHINNLKKGNSHSGTVHEPDHIINAYLLEDTA